MDLKPSPFTPVHSGTSPQPEQAHAPSLIPCKRENDLPGVPDATDREKRPRCASNPNHQRARFMAQHFQWDWQNVDHLSAENRQLSLEDPTVRRRLAQEAGQGLQETPLRDDVPLTLEQACWVALRAPFLAQIDLQQKLLDAVFHYLDQAPQPVIAELTAIVDADAGQEAGLTHPVLKELAAGLHNIGMTDPKEQAVILLGCFAEDMTSDTFRLPMIKITDILEGTPKYAGDAERAFSQQGFIMSLLERFVDHTPNDANHSPSKIAFVIAAFTYMSNPSDNSQGEKWLSMDPLFCERACALAQKHRSHIGVNSANSLLMDLPKNIYFRSFPSQCHASALSLLHTVSEKCMQGERSEGTSYIADILAEGILGSDVKSQKAVLDIFSDSKDFFAYADRHENDPMGYDAYESLDKAIKAGYIDDTLLPRAKDLVAELYEGFIKPYIGSDSESEDAMNMYADEEIGQVPKQHGIDEPASKQLLLA